MKPSILLIFVALLAAGAASAQDFARARLEKSPRHQEWVKAKHGAREVQCFLVFPEVKDKATTVVLIHEIMGLSDWVRSMADQLAEAGYIAIAPDLLSGMAPGRGGTAEFSCQVAIRRAVSSLPPDVEKFAKADRRARRYSPDLWSAASRTTRRANYRSMPGALARVGNRHPNRRC